MGYTLRIGEYAPSFEEDGEGYTYISHNAEAVHHDDAPAFGEPTDGENQRWPSYSAWADFATLTGLKEIFEGRRSEESKSLLREHPGCFPLVAYHKQVIDAAAERFKQLYPAATPAMSEPVENGLTEFEATVNCHYARLTWLKYWVDWALANCKHPVFYNS